MPFLLRSTGVFLVLLALAAVVSRFMLPGSVSARSVFFVALAVFFAYLGLSLLRRRRAGTPRRPDTSSEAPR